MTITITDMLGNTYVYEEPTFTAGQLCDIQSKLESCSDCFLLPDPANPGGTIILYSGNLASTVITPPPPAKTKK